MMKIREINGKECLTLKKHYVTPESVILSFEMTDILTKSIDDNQPNEDDIFAN